MSSTSTPIENLNRSDDNPTEDTEESMMVNSILKDIENDNEDDINLTNENSLNYTVDTSQIPPKIGNDIPSVETIKETTNTIFNEPMPSIEPKIDTEKDNKEIDDFLNNKIEDTKNNEEPKKETSILDKLKDKVLTGSILIITFIILSLPFVNSLIVRYIPKLSNNGNISVLCIFIKGIILAIIYGLSSIFL